VFKVLIVLGLFSKESKSTYTWQGKANIASTIANYSTESDQIDGSMPLESQLC